MSAFIWASAVFGIAVVFFFTFRSPLAGFISRANKIGFGKFAFTARATKQVQAAPRLAEELLQAFDNPLLLEQEHLIRSDLKLRGLGSQDDDTTRILVRHLASTQIALLFNQIDRMIWGSQVTYLHFLNASPNGTNLDQANVFYENAQEAFPDAYSNYALGDWIGFLRDVTHLVTEQDGVIRITVRGRQFLAYLTQLGTSITGRAF